MLTPQQIEQARAIGRAQQAAKQQQAAPRVELVKPPEQPGSAMQQFGAGIEGAAAGVASAATAIPQVALAGAEAIGRRLTDEPGALLEGIRDLRQELGGRQLVESAVEFAHKAVLPEDEAAEAMREWRIRARDVAAQYPTTATIGEIAGNVAGIMATGGAGIAGAGRAIERGVAGVGGRMAGLAARGMAEGALMGASVEQDRAWLEERQLTGEQVLAAAGPAGLLGGGLSVVGGLLGAAGRGVGRAIRKGATAAEGGAVAATAEQAAAVSTAGGAGAKVSVTVEPSRIESAAKQILGAKDSDVLAAGRAMFGDEVSPQMPQMARELASGKAVRPQMVSQASDALHSDLTRVMESQDTLLDEVLRNKDLNVADQIRLKPPPPGAARVGREVGEQAWRDLGVIQEEMGRRTEKALRLGGADEKMAARAGAAARARLASLRGEVGELVARAKNDPAEVYAALDDARARILKTSQAMAETAGNAPNTELAREWAQKIEGIYANVREHLYDEGVWGVQGVAQREVNAAWPAYIDAKNYAFGDISRKTGEVYLGGGLPKIPKLEILEGKTASIIESLDTPAGRDKLKSMMRYVDATERLGLSIEKGYTLGPQSKKAADALRDSALKVRRTIAESLDKVHALEQAEQLLRQGESGGHGVVGGAIHAVATATGFEGATAAAAQRVRLEASAARTARKVVDALRWVGGTAGKTTEAAGEAVGGAARKVSPVLRPVRVSTLAQFVGKHETPEDAMRERALTIRDASRNNGEAIRDAVSRSFGDAAIADPHAVGALAAAATRGVEFLKGQLPSTTLPSLTPATERVTSMPSRVEIQQFADLYHAVNSPLDVLARVGQSGASTAQIQAIAHVYPQLYSYAKTVIARKIRKLDAAGTPIPFQQRVNIDTVMSLDGAGERVLQDDFAMRYGPGFIPRPPPPPPPARGPSKSLASLTTQTDQMLGAKS